MNDLSFIWFHNNKNIMTNYISSGKDRIGVPLFKDGTYLKVERPSDHDLAKSLYYTPYGDHITKYIMVCTATPKVC